MHQMRRANVTHQVMRMLLRFFHELFTVVGSSLSAAGPPLTQCSVPGVALEWLVQEFAAVRAHLRGPVSGRVDFPATVERGPCLSAILFLPGFLHPLGKSGKRAAPGLLAARLSDHRQRRNLWAPCQRLQDMVVHRAILPGRMMC